MPFPKMQKPASRTGWTATPQAAAKKLVRVNEYFKNALRSTRFQTLIKEKSYLFEGFTSTSMGSRESFLSHLGHLPSYW